MRRWLDQTADSTLTEYTAHVLECPTCRHVEGIPNKHCPIGRELQARYALRYFYEAQHKRYIQFGRTPYEAEAMAREDVTVQMVRNELDRWSDLSPQDRGYLALRLMELANESTENESESDGEDGGTEQVA